MAKIDKIKEKINHFRFWIGVLMVILIGLVSWFVSNYKSGETIFIVLNIISMFVVIFLVFLFNKRIIQNIEKLEDL